MILVRLRVGARAHMLVRVCVCAVGTIQALQAIHEKTVVIGLLAPLQIPILNRVHTGGSD